MLGSAATLISCHTDSIQEKEKMLLLSLGAKAAPTLEEWSCAKSMNIELLSEARETLSRSTADDTCYGEKFI